MEVDGTHLHGSDLALRLKIAMYEPSIACWKPQEESKMEGTHEPTPQEQGGHSATPAAAQEMQLRIRQLNFANGNFKAHSNRDSMR